MRPSVDVYQRYWTHIAVDGGCSSRGLIPCCENPWRSPISKPRPPSLLCGTQMDNTLGRWSPEKGCPNISADGFLIAHETYKVAIIRETSDRFPSHSGVTTTGIVFSRSLHTRLAFASFRPSLKSVFSFLLWPSQPRNIILSHGRRETI